jgi:hypothetical protein
MFIGVVSSGHCSTRNKSSIRFLARSVPHPLALALG